MRRIVLALFVLATPNLFAQEAPEPYLLLSVDRDCGSKDDDKRLAEAIRLRIPRVFIVRGDLSGKRADWTVTWRPETESTCVLDFASQDNASTMSLGPEASPEDIELAASRVAWLASISDPNDENPPEESPPEEEVPTEPIEEPTEEPVEEEKLVEEKPPPEEKPAEIPEPESLYKPVAWKVSIVPGVVYFSETVKKGVPVPKTTFNVIGGSGTRMRGFELGFLWNRQTENMNGTQVVLGTNIVEGQADGGQIALGVNTAGVESNVVQIGLGVNKVGGNSFALQLGIGANIATGNIRGTQLGIGSNVATGDVNGVQFALGANVAQKVKGLQFSLFNFAGEVEGAQIGLLNVAKTSDVSLGAINILWGEPIYATVFGGSSRNITAGVQHGGKYLRYALLAGVMLGDRANAYEFGLGLGLHIGEPIFWDTDLFVYQTAVFGEPFERLSLHGQLKTALGYQVAKRLAVFAGVDANVLITGLPNASDFLPNYAVDIANDGAGRTFYVWPGVHVGARF